MLLKEYCTENFTLIPKAIRAGAKRIELCDNLAVGGTTASTGVLEESIHYCQEQQISIMAMIRPRGGDFIYNDLELKMMHTDLIEAKKLGVDGVVFGCLTPDNHLDKESTKLLADAAEGLQITFHMAFDQLDHSEQLEAMDTLIDYGITRILTHGGPLSLPITKNIPHLKKLISYASGRIIILPGGGITAENAEGLQFDLNVNELHGTKIVAIE